MKERVQEAMACVASTLGAAALYRARERRKRQLLRVLVFHDLPEGAWFDEIVAMLVEEFCVVGPEVLEEKRSGPASEADVGMRVLLSFDDGFASWEKIALPVLEARGATGLFFISSGLIDVAGKEAEARAYVENRLGVRYRKPLSWAGVRAVAAGGHRIGAHTVTHPNLASLAAEEEEREIGDGKKKLEDETGVQVQDFAYPFGRWEHFTRATETRLREAGYARGFTTMSRFVRDSDFPWRIPRLCITEGQRLGTVRRYCAGAYDLVGRSGLWCRGSG